MAKAEHKFSDYTNLKFKGVKVKWAQVQPDQYDQFEGGEKKHKINVLVNDKLGDSLEAEGIKVKYDEEEDSKYIVAKAKGDKDVPGYKRIPIVGADGRTPVEDQLGNGTKVNIILQAKKWPRIANVTLYIKGIQVLELAEYNSGGLDFEDESGGTEEDGGLNFE